jgi:hypothetical protein
MHKHFYFTLTLITLILCIGLVNATSSVTEFTINSSASYTNDSNLLLTINATSTTGAVYQAKFSCSGDPNKWTDYTTFNSTMYFDINTSNYDCNTLTGTKTIYVDVNFTDNSQAQANSSIIFDKVAPTTTSFSPTSSVTGDGASGREIIIGLSDDINLSSVSITLLRGSTIIYDSNSTKCTITETRTNCSFTDLRVDRNGSYTYNYIITDMAGNTKSDSNSFTFTDSTPPLSAPNAPLGVDRNNNIDLSWAQNALNDFNIFALYRSTQSGFDCNSATLIVQTDNNYYSDTGLDENTIYYYKLKAIDFTGNASACSNQNYFTTDYNLNITPTITRTDTTCDSNQWCNSNDPEFEITQTNAQFSWILTTSTTTLPANCTYGSDCNTSPAEFSNVSDGTYYFKVKGCKPTGCSGVSTYIVKIDATQPSQPIPTATLSGYDTKLTWTASTDTGGSGLYQYYIYRSTSPSFYTSNSTYITAVDDSNLTITLSNSTHGVTYYYKVLAKDIAGNYSRDTNAPIVTVTVPTNLNQTTLNVIVKNSEGKETIYFSKAQDFNLTFVFSRDVNDVYLYRTIDGGTRTTILDANDNILNYSYLFTASATHKDINFYIKGSSLINDINKEIHLYFDNTPPTISYVNVDTNKKFTTDTNIEIIANDNFEIQKVELFLDNISLGNATYDVNKWIINLEVNKSKNSVLKAIVTDKVGLTAQVSKNIVLSFTPIDTNTDTNLIKINLTLENVITKLNELTNLKNELDTKIVAGLVLTPAQKILKDEADILIDDAEKLIDTNLELANSKTLEAQNKYAQIISETKNSNLSTLSGDIMSIILLGVIILIICGIIGGAIFILNKQGKLNFNKKPIEHAHNKHNLEIDDDLKTNDKPKKITKISKPKKDKNLLKDEDIPIYESKN